MDNTVNSQLLNFLTPVMIYSPSILGPWQNLTFWTYKNQQEEKAELSFYWFPQANNPLPRPTTEQTCQKPGRPGLDIHHTLGSLRQTPLPNTGRACPKTQIDCAWAHRHSPLSSCSPIQHSAQILFLPHCHISAQHKQRLPVGLETLPTTRPPGRPPTHKFLFSHCTNP